MLNPVITEDGDTITIIAKTPSTVSDPIEEFPYVANSFRVVADRVNQTLVLVPLGANGVAVSVYEVARAQERIANQLALIAGAKS